MTRKDFELIAEVIATAWQDSSETKRALAYDMANALATTNPRFNRETFLQACGVK